MIASWLPSHPTSAHCTLPYFSSPHPTLLHPVPHHTTHHHAMPRHAMLHHAHPTPPHPTPPLPTTPHHTTPLTWQAFLRVFESALGLLSRAPPLVGQRVVIAGLLGRAELNGVNGVATHFNESSGRYAVQLVDKTVVALKPSNLAAAAITETASVCFVAPSTQPHPSTPLPVASPSLPPGTSVTIPAGSSVLIRGLQGRPELNGSVGTTGRFDASRGRYEVVVRGEGEQGLLLRPENLLETSKLSREQEAAVGGGQTRCETSGENGQKVESDGVCGEDELDIAMY